MKSNEYREHETKINLDVIFNTFSIIKCHAEIIIIHATLFLNCNWEKSTMKNYADSFQDKKLFNNLLPSLFFSLVAFVIIKSFAKCRIVQIT